MPGDLDLSRLHEAAVDFRYLLNRGYPRAASLTLVGNHRQIDHAGRQLLHRAIFGTESALRRRAKRRRLAQVPPGPLGIDGHNVLITLECGLRGLPLVLADDGFLRDIGEVSRAFRPSAVTDAALNLLARHLQLHHRGHISIWYDAPLSRSGELAARTLSVLQSHELQGQAGAVPVPEHYLLNFPGPVCTSDTGLIDRLADVVDLPGEILLTQEQVTVVVLP